MTMYEYDDDSDSAGSKARLVVGIVTVAALLAGGWFVLRPALGDDEEATPGSSSVTSTADRTSPDAIGPGSTGPAGDGAVATTAGSATTARAPSQPAATTEPPSSESLVATPATAAATTSTPGEPLSTTTAAATTVPSPVVTTGPAAPTALPAFSTSPDGTPLPVVATFDLSEVRLDGAVPDQAASDLLAALARANHRTPDTVTVTNNLLINAAVPRSVGVRVLELTSARFPEGSAEVLPLHAAELDRVVTIMTSLPNLTVLVVGHADQRGDDAVNFQLSDQRARSVVNYLVGRGIDGTRLSSRAVGEDELLSLNDDAAALALNRRTEFVFYGLLLG